MPRAAQPWSSFPEWTLRAARPRSLAETIVAAIGHAVRASRPEMGKLSPPLVRTAPVLRRKQEKEKQSHAAVDWPLTPAESESVLNGDSESLGEGLWAAFATAMFQIAARKLSSETENGSGRSPPRHRPLAPKGYEKTPRTLALGVLR